MAEKVRFGLCSGLGEDVHPRRADRSSLVGRESELGTMDHVIDSRPERRRR
jgi:hypothetical protein